MQIHAARLAIVAALLTSLYACSSTGGAGGDDTNDAGTTPDGATPMGTGSDASAGSDGSTHPGDGGDGGIRDAATGGDGEAGVDASLDAGMDSGPPPAPAVQFVGRFDTAPAGGPKVSWPGASITARWHGTEVSATFADQIAYSNYGPSRWEVIVDGVSTTVLSITRAQGSYPLASGLPLGDHTVQLYKLTETSVGISQFMGFDFNGGTLLAPPPSATRHLEFLGDSAANGYGVECTSNQMHFSSATENEHLSYPALIADALSADHQNLSAAGKGLYWNYYRPDTEVFSILYPRTIAFAVAGTAWDFTQYTPDVVWMTLGGNDWDQPNPGDPAPPFASYQAKYDEMVTLIRNKHPSAHLVCAVAASLNDNYPSGYNAYTNVKTALNNVVSAHAGAGDTKIYAFEFTRAADADLTGCEYHPNKAKHVSMATEATAFIKSKTGWL